MAETLKIPTFAEGIEHFNNPWDQHEAFGATSIINSGDTAEASKAMAYQTLMAADALRYLTVLLAASKASGHPGGFCSSADSHAALYMLGHKNILTEVGHHAPGFYSGLFLDRSLEKMGINTVAEMCSRFREKNGLLGHLSGAIPGVLNPGGPLGQGQHFALSAAYLNRDTLFPVTIGDGGMGEPYVMSAFQHFITAFPNISNFLPVLIWNGFSQEHHSMVATLNNESMTAYWRAHGFRRVVLVDASEYGDSGNSDDYVDSSEFPLSQRLEFMQALLSGVKEAAATALGLDGKAQPTVFIIKQLKGAGSHAKGSKSHHLYPQYTLDHPVIQEGLQRRALWPEAWSVVRQNFCKAGGGPASETVVSEKERNIAALPELEPEDFAVEEDLQIPSTSMGKLVVKVGQADPLFLVANADGNEASGFRNVSDGLVIRHPIKDDLYSQGPDGRVFEPISEDACAGLTSAISLFGGRSLWFSYVSFVINGLPMLQTVAQAMCELRLRRPAHISFFTAGALEQGRNGWTHQRPEVEAYFAALMRSGNVYPVFPSDANGVQAAYLWGLEQENKVIGIFASKSPLPVRLTAAESREAVEKGAFVYHETNSGEHPDLVVAAAGDMILLPVMKAVSKLEETGRNIRVVLVVNPRRFFQPNEIAWENAQAGDGQFLSQDEVDRLLGNAPLLAVTGGASAVFEPLLLRARTAKKTTAAWQRGETTATPDELLAVSKLDPENLIEKAEELLA
ncbi:MAG: phosphoketolase [Puniceicoccaceae bacterium]